MKLAMIVGAALVACASIAAAKPHTAADTSFLQISGGSTCPAETTQVVTGSTVIFRNANNGNLTEDARCWQTPPASTSQVDVLILGPCVVCRFGP
jgi:hypothetical protein